MNIPDHYPKRPSILKYNSINLQNSIYVDDSIKSNFTDDYDIVMVFPLKDYTEQSKECKYCLHAMLTSGMEIYPYKSVQDDELMVLVRAPEKVLAQFADGIDYQLKINPEALQRTIEAGDPEHRIKGVKVLDDRDICEYSPYEHIYLEYRRTHDPSMYARQPGNTTPFDKPVRLKLIYNLLRAPKSNGGCGLELSKLLHKKKILAMYPLHEKKLLKTIENACLDKSVFPWDLPIHDIKSYFGEKLALYNVFLGHYSYWLIVPSIVGLAFQLVVWGTLDFSSPVLPFYSLIITVWSVFMLEYWKRQEAIIALFWGMSKFESQEQDRPEYKGSSMKSFIDGRDITYNPPSLARKVMTFTQSLIAVFIAVVIGVVAGIYFFRFTLQRHNSTSPYASTVASVLNTIQILIFNAIYQVVALKLTDLENHRTDTSYEDSLIMKMFVFQFINSYASFFFLAFIAGNLDRPDNVPDDFVGQCGATSCMEPLSINLAIIFGSRLTITNFLDILIPWFTHKQKIRKETSGIAEEKKADITPAEEQYYLMEYNTLIQSIQNYADTAVQYGFTLLFITALPCASFFSLINNYVKVKFNAWKLCNLYQRPIPSGAQDIGTWQLIFTIISVASVVTNAGLICFTMDVLYGYSLQGRVWIFIGFQWVLIFCQFIAQAIVPDVPESVTIQMDRTEFFKDKVIEFVEDEDFDETEEDEEFDEGDGLGVGCCGIPRKSKSKKLKEGLQPMPDLHYPHGKPSTAWPDPLHAQDSRLAGIVAPSSIYVGVKETVVQGTESASNPAHQNYASAHSAVPGAAKDTTADNYI